MSSSSAPGGNPEASTVQPQQQQQQLPSPPEQHQHHRQDSPASAQSHVTPTTAPMGLVTGILHRLRAPRILSDPAYIPAFRQTCFPPARGSRDATADSAQDDSRPQPEAESEAGDESEPTTWEEHASTAPSTSFTHDFASLLEARDPSRASSPGTWLSLVFFGEQHHQPHVVRSQVQLLAALDSHLRGREHVLNQARGRSRPVRYHLHLLLEHFSLLDQPLLDAFSADKLTPAELTTLYAETSQEGFRVGMYSPLLMLARERGVGIWGGFPPRSWAREVAKGGWEVGRERERERSESGPRQERGSHPTPPLLFATHAIPRFSVWSSVYTLAASQRVFLSSLLRPAEPPRFPCLPAAAGAKAQHDPQVGEVEQGHSTEQPGQQLNRHQSQPLPQPTPYPTHDLPTPADAHRGFPPAQALKDSYLAHVAGCLLERGHEMRGTGGEKCTEQALIETNVDIDASAEVEHRNVVLVVAGLGHVEAGMGAPERIAAALDASSSDGEGEDDVETSPAGDTLSEGPGTDLAARLAQRGSTLTIVSKPLDSPLWLGPEWIQPQPRTDAPGAEAGSVDTPPAHTPSRDRDRDHDQGWARPLADAVVLYEWVDLDEGVGEESNVKTGTEPRPGGDEAGAGAQRGEGGQAPASAPAQEGPAHSEEERRG